MKLPFGLPLNKKKCVNFLNQTKNDPLTKPVVPL